MHPLGAVVQLGAHLSPKEKIIIIITTVNIKYIFIYSRKDILGHRGH